MNIDWVEIRSQLAPKISPVNIGLTLILLYFAWPLGLLMLGYMFKGRAIGLDLRQPATYLPAFTNLIDAGKSAIEKLTNAQSSSSDQTSSTTSRSYQPTTDVGGKPDLAGDDFERWRQSETAKLKRERAELEREKMMFEARKKASEDSH